MEQFEFGKKIVDAERCAAAVLETIPAVMLAIRSEMRHHRPADLTVQHFRALAYVDRWPGLSLSDVADHVGLTPPAASYLVDRLVARGLLSRESAQDDRRRITLRLTPEGKAALQASNDAALERIESIISPLPSDKQETIVQAMEALRSVFVLGSTEKPSHPTAAVQGTHTEREAIHETIQP